jgi:hypothetical protein
MAYIGRGTDSISNVEVLDNITFSGASSYTLQKGSANYVPISAANILVSIDGVVQANNFSVNGSTIDFGVAIANTSTCNFVLHFGTGLITTVQDGAVTTVKIGNDAVTYAKLQNLATANRVLGSTSTGLIGETQIATDMIIDDSVNYAKMQDVSQNNRLLGAETAGTIAELQVNTNMIADAQVDESKLKISNAPTNGYFLSAQSGGSGGMTWAEAGGGGKILNVYQVSYDTTISTTSNSYQTTNLTKTLTPSSTSSDFLIQFNFGVQKIQSASSSSQYVQLKRGSTVLEEWSDGWMLYEATGGGSRGYPPGHFILVDQPATTSAITYSVEYKSEVSGAISGSEGNKTMIIWEIEGVS